MIEGRLWRTMAVGAGVVLVFWMALVWTWGDAPYTLTFDDAYYFFEIGSNLADGHGFTFDRINETNGFMPLWQAITVPFFAAGLEGETAARVLLEVQLVTWLAAAVVMARTIDGTVAGFPRLAAAGRDAAAPVVIGVATIGFTALVGSPYVLRTLTNGLESGITDLLYALLLAAAVRHRGDLVTSTTSRQRLGLSVLLSLTFLGRTDALVLLGTLGLWSLAQLRAATGTEQATAGSGALRRIVELFALPALVVVAYLSWNAVAFGTPIQISGVVKRVTPGATELIGMAIVVALAAFAAVRSWRRRATLSADERFPRVAIIWSSTGWFAAFLVLTVGYYVLLSAQQWLWYFAPHVVYLLLLGGALLVDFAEAAVAEAPKRHTPMRALAPVAALFILPLVVSLPLQWSKLTDPNQRSIQLANRDAGLWISANLPPDAVLGSWDAGVVGYFADQPVVNLDGVVNSIDWYHAQRDGTTGAFLDESGVSYLVNHAALVEGTTPGVDEQVRGLFQDPGARAEQLHRVEFRYSGRFEGSPDSGGLKELAVFVHRVIRSATP